MDEQEKTGEIKKPQRDALGRLLPGNTANPHGRPINAWSIKDKVRQRLQENPGEFEEFVKHFTSKNKELGWQMLEGRPHQSGNVEVSMPESLIELIKNVATISETDTDIPKEDSE